jgi:hypothetical protein
MHVASRAHIDVASGAIFRQQGSINAYNGSTINVAKGATFEAKTILYDANTTAITNVAGTLSFTGGTATVANINLTGSLDAKKLQEGTNGRLSFTGANNVFGAGSKVEVQGAIEVKSGSLVIDEGCESIIVRDKYASNGNLYEGRVMLVGDASITYNKDNAVTIGGNWDRLKGNIKKVVEKYKGTQLTEDNVDYVKNLKKQFVSLRTGVELDFKNYKTAYLDPAESLLKAVKMELLAVIDEGESALGKQLDEYDQRRKDELTIVLNEYVKDSVEKYGLREEYAVQIQFKKEYYNKTQKEEDSIDDIENQAMELAKKQKEYDNGVELIKAECEDAGLLPDAYIRELQYKVATEIILEIKQDKKSRAELKAKEEGGEKVEIGEDADSEIAKQMKKASSLDNVAKRERILRVRYLPSQAKLMGDFFKKNSIEFEFIKQDF